VKESAADCFLIFLNTLRVAPIFYASNFLCERVIPTPLLFMNRSVFDVRAHLKNGFATPAVNSNPISQWDGSKTEFNEPPKVLAIIQKYLQCVKSIDI